MRTITALCRSRLDRPDEDEAFKEAWRLFPRYAGKGLGFTDCTTIALMRRMDVENLVSFDADFDGITSRIS